MLGYLDDNSTSSDEHLDWSMFTQSSSISKHTNIFYLGKPLACGFPLTDGIAYFTLDPSRNLTTRDSYVLCRTFLKPL